MSQPQVIEVRHMVFCKSYNVKEKSMKLSRHHESLFIKLLEPSIIDWLGKFTEGGKFGTSRKNIKRNV